MATLTDQSDHAEKGAAPSAPPGFYPTHVGELSVAIISDGFLPAEVGRLAAEVEVDEVVRYLVGRGVDVTRLATQISCVLIRNHPVGGVTLVDGGIGTLPAAGGQPVATAGHVRENLELAGVKPEQVQTILVSHLHPDHIGGFFADDDSPVYPNATFYVPSTEAEFWSQESPDLSGQLAPPGMREGEVLFAQRFLRLAAGRTRMYTPGDTVLDQVLTVDLAGHAPGQAGFIFASGEDSLFYTADAAGQPVVSIEHPDWRFALDMDPELAKQTRRRLVADLQASGQRFFSPHFPWPNLGRVGTLGGSPAWMPEAYRWDAS